MCLISISAPTFGENIGFVDLQKVFVNYNETEKAKAGFEKKQTELRKELEKNKKKNKHKKTIKNLKRFRNLLPKFKKNSSQNKKSL